MRLNWLRNPLHSGLVVALAMIAVGVYLWVLPQVAASAEQIQQQRIEASARAQATTPGRLHYLQVEGPLTTVAVRQVTFKQANATLALGTTDCAEDWGRPVWVVVFRGKTLLYGPPSESGSNAPQINDDGHLYLVLDASGSAFAWGTKDATPLDFGAPVPPTPAPCPRPPAGAGAPEPPGTPVPNIR